MWATIAGGAHSLAVPARYAIAPVEPPRRRPSLTSSVNAMTDPSRAHAPVANLFTASLAETDPEVAEVVKCELSRQRDEIELIASENIVSKAVLEAQGSVLTNKYAEGLPGRRYYGGCQYVDVAENLAIERVTKLFGCRFANVQPHSGASANAAAFMALMVPGDTFMGLNLAAGGHLTHGSPANMAGKRVSAASTARRASARAARPIRAAATFAASARAPMRSGPS